MNLTIHFAEINWLAVITVTIISFALGSIWHSKVLFGKAWTEEVKPNHDLSKKMNFVLIFGLSGILHFIAVTGLAVFIGKESTVMIGLLKGLFVSLVWISVSIGVTYIFAKRSLRLFLIDAGFYVVFFTIAGIILGAW